jgi:osmotically-inducible protein OsmY
MNTRMKKIVMAGALIAAASVLSSQAADQSDAIPATVNGQPASEDQRINNEVMNKLSEDSRLSGKIGTTTEGGEVTLNGLVSTWGEAQRAERDAERVEGVTEVHNHINALAGKNF